MEIFSRYPFAPSFQLVLVRSVDLFFMKLLYCSFNKFFIWHATWLMHNNIVCCIAFEYAFRNFFDPFNFLNVSFYPLDTLVICLCYKTLLFSWSIIGLLAQCLPTFFCILLHISIFYFPFLTRICLAGLWTPTFTNVMFGDWSRYILVKSILLDCYQCMSIILHLVLGTFLWISWLYLHAAQEKIS